MSAGVLSSLAVPAALLVVWGVWGLTYLAIQVGFESFGPLWLNALRNLLAGGLVLAWIVARGRPLPGREAWRQEVLPGLLIVLGGAGGGSLALRSASSSVVALVFACTPIWSVLLAALSRERPRPRDGLGVLLGAAAIAVLQADGQFQADGAALWLVLGATLCWALGADLGRRAPRSDALGGAGVQMLAGGLGCAALAGGLEAPPQAVTPAAALALAYLVVFGSVLAYGAYLFLLPRVSPALGGSHAFVNPFVALVLGWAVAGEVLTTAHAGAMALMFLALVALAGGAPASSAVPAAAPATS